jgi:hypothetical protein
MHLSRKYRTENDLLHINRVETISTKSASLTIGWQVRFKRKSGYHSKFFSDSTFGSKEQALDAARAYRNGFLKDNNEDLGQVMTERAFVLPHLPKSNTSGILGICRSTGHEKNGNTFYVWQSTYRNIDGKIRNSTYRVHRYGEVGALIAAVRFRRDGIEEIARLTKNQKAVDVIKVQIESYDQLISFLESAGQDEIETITLTLARTDVPPSTKKRFIETRVTQRQFRDAVRMFFGDRCAITGAAHLLIASHIKPWSECSDPERIDPYNGILFSASYDRAFDVGLITFDCKGTIIISTQFVEDAHLLGINTAACISGYSAMHDRYMQFHRINVFKSR